MIIFDAERPSDSAYVERVWRSHSEGVSPFLSIAESRCELVVARSQGTLSLIVRGPETRATLLENYPEDGEWLGIRLRPGVALAPLPASAIVDTTVTLPTVSASAFWLGGAAWRFPDYENADTFVDRLARAGLLQREQVVGEALRGTLDLRASLSPRSLERRFLRTMGVTQSAARQIERARYATLLLRQGVAISAAALAAGYFDQAHLTHAFKRYIGESPGQIARAGQSARLSFLYKTELFW
jgi:AraC-like DNA-binding protein